MLKLLLKLLVSGARSAMPKSQPKLMLSAGPKTKLVYALISLVLKFLISGAVSALPTLSPKLPISGTLSAALKILIFQCEAYRPNSLPCSALVVNFQYVVELDAQSPYRMPPIPGASSHSCFLGVSH
ncbi:hypothetical protein B0H10DRAFT_1154732 [Mycena sp. CBHHK59/15]|nr:hypothetical protein B0H10DRAFT_1154732 [Mycena sp. CBHHK59/15]